MSPLELEFDPKLRVAGEEVAGILLLNYKELQKTALEDIHVKLRGSVFTHIERRNGPGERVERTKIELVRENQTLWTPQTAYPPADTHILRLPFRFVLPLDLPPSCEFDAHQKYGAVAYSIEVVGQRAGLRFNKRILCAIPVLPYDISGAQLREELRLGDGWAGRMHVWEQKRKIRKGIWGAYSSVNMRLSMPDVKAYPIFAPIPFTLRIETVTKQMQRQDTPGQGPIFPAPPTDPRDIEFKLMTRVTVRAGMREERWRDELGMLGGFGRPGTPTVSSEVPHVEVHDKVWVPADGRDDKSQKGAWKQQVIFTSSFTLQCSPSFTSRTMDLEYHLHLMVPFSGVGNDLRQTIPFTIITSMSPPDRGVNWDGPPPELELPPSYMGGSAWKDGYDDEK